MVQLPLNRYSKPHGLWQAFTLPKSTNTRLLSSPNPASFLACFLDKCITQSSLKLCPWEPLGQLLPCPLLWSTNSPLAWDSCTCPMSGFQLPDSTKPSLTWLPLWPSSKASHFQRAISFSLKIQILSTHPHQRSLPTEQNRNSSVLYWKRFTNPPTYLSSLICYIAPNMLGRVCHAVK